MEAIGKEIALCRKSNEMVNTIYFGGGTPSLLSNATIDELLKKIRENFCVASNAEITLEANPDDITKDKLQGWKASGINRLSIGIQSFFEESLRWMNRMHHANQAVDNLHLALQYFNNITIDLIYGVPGLTDEMWRLNVQTAIKLGIPHLSCYALTVEPKTPLYKLIRHQKKMDIDASQQAAQFVMLMDWLQDAGYEHYEISNFAKPGFKSRHNSSYWQGKNYIGFGPSAHSYNGAVRRWNVANNQQYINAIHSNTIPFEEEVLTEKQKFNEYVMISLRTIDGIDVSTLNDNDARYLQRASQKYIAQKLLQQCGDQLQLTRQGKLFADGIAADLFKT